MISEWIQRDPPQRRVKTAYLSPSAGPESSGSLKVTKPGREKAESETIKCLNKVRQWFRERQARIVIDAVQRRAVAAFRQQQ